MKWLQLDCNFSEDPKVRILAREWGGETAAAFWTLLLGYVGQYGIPGCRVKIEEFGEYCPQHIASKLSSKPNVTLRRLGRAAEVGLIDKECWENDRVIFIPKMLKRVDEYTRKVRTKSDKPPDKLPAIFQLQSQLQTEEQKQLRSRLAAGFEELWAKYPVRQGRKDAEKHFNASVKTDADLAVIRISLPNYLQHLALNDWKRPQSGKTWFNNWRDWVEWVEPPPIARRGSVIERPVMADPEHVHRCKHCGPSHDWVCDAPAVCNMQREICCPTFAAKFDHTKTPRGALAGLTSN